MKLTVERLQEATKKTGIKFAFAEDRSVTFTCDEGRLECLYNHETDEWYIFLNGKRCATVY